MPHSCRPPGSGTGWPGTSGVAGTRNHR